MAELALRCRHSDLVGLRHPGLTHPVSSYCPDGLGRVTRRTVDWCWDDDSGSLGAALREVGGILGMIAGGIAIWKPVLAACPEPIKSPSFH